MGKRAGHDAVRPFHHEHSFASGSFEYEGFSKQIRPLVQMPQVHRSQEIFLAIVVVVDRGLRVLDSIRELIEIKAMIAVLSQQIIGMLDDESLAVRTLACSSIGDGHIILVVN